MARKKTDISIRSSAAEYLTFVAASGGSDEAVEMRYEDENLWLTQKMMAVLYDVDVRTVNDHIKKVLSDGELTEEATIRKFRIVQTEGTRQVNREVLHYSLQMVNRWALRSTQSAQCSSASGSTASRTPIPLRAGSWTRSG